MTLRPDFARWDMQVRRELRVLLLHACSFVLGWVACYMLVSRQQSGSDDRYFELVKHCCNVLPTGSCPPETRQR